MEKYQSFEQDARALFQKHKNKSRLIATIRVLYFLGSLVILYFTLPYDWKVTALVGLGLLVGFVGLVIWYQKSEHIRNYWKTRLKLIAQEKQRLDYNLYGLDEGNEFSDNQHLYLRDLDIFGRRSLFAYLSRANTSSGRKRLADWLKNPAHSTQIRTRQEIIRELKTKTPLRLHFQTTAQLTEETEQELTLLRSWLKAKDDFLHKKILQLARFVIPVLVVLIWVLVLSGIINYRFGFLASILSLALVGVYFKKLKTTYEQVGKNIPLLQKYARLWQIIENSNFEDSETLALQNKLKGSAEAAKSLTKQLNLFEYRFNAFAFLFLNGLFLWDVQFAFSLEKWRKKHYQDLDLWIDTLANFEAIFSLASFSYNHPEYIFPKQSKHFDIQEIAHPLLPESVRITNNLKIDNLQEIALITGSNMAGKSTFLRTLGVNMVLACTGAPVCAKKFEFVPMRICTSMRIIDSLEKGESSFFAELKRLKQILDELQTGKQHLVLLDEILRGTNSKDRYLGSVAIIKQLLKLPAVALIASHDVELSRMEEDFPEKISNYAFEVENTDTGLHYPYKIKKGVCQNTNAVFLMEKMGIEMS